LPNSPGVPAALAEQTLVVEYNNLEQVQELFSKYGQEIACIIVEPVAGNMNCVAPVEGFLQGLRQICDEYGSVLIFDEVMTGFRVALGGAQAFYQVTPDLTTLGKVIGGGMPVGAFGGKREIMQHIAPLGAVYQAGTLSGNPVAMAAGLATLELIADPMFFVELSVKTEQFVQDMVARARTAEIEMHGVAVGGMFGLFFTEASRMDNFAQVSTCNVERFNRFFHLMLDQGIYLAPSAFEAGFMSAAHTERDIELTLNAAETAFRQLR
jgi:glutamate-1-semialdehyde 2,1-aminomutase